jgi:glutamate--cysteine ligase
MGWYNRRKSEHFRAYEEIVRDFATAFGLDPWVILASFHRCGVVNFGERTGIECVALGVEKVLHAVRRKYAEYGIKEEPYVYVKADSGTYGMGVMTVKSGEEITEINKKTRNKMGVIKEGTPNTEVIIQEGIPTIDVAQGAIAEPMIYLIDGVPVGGAYRVNDERDALSNLNASGMRFVGMCDEGECGEEVKDRVETTECNFGVFGLVAALAALAAGREVYGGLDIGFVI